MPWSLARGHGTWAQRPVIYIAGIVLWLCFLRGAARELRMIAPAADAPDTRSTNHHTAPHRRPLAHLGTAARNLSSEKKRAVEKKRGSEKRPGEKKSRGTEKLRGTELLSLSQLVIPNRTTFKTRSGQCVQRVVSQVGSERDCYG